MADPLTNDLVEIALRLQDCRVAIGRVGLTDRRRAALEAIKREHDALMVAAEMDPYAAVAITVTPTGASNDDG